MIVKFSKIVKNGLLRGKKFYDSSIFLNRTSWSEKMGDSQGVSRYEGDEEDIAVIEEWLIKYRGGNVSLTLDDDSGVAKICLDRPDKMNAMSGQMMVELGGAVRRLEEWSQGKAVLLYGNGRMFCSGGDLDFARGTGNAKSGFRMATYMIDVLTRLKNLPMVSVAVLHGFGALGGGSEISLSCDWRLMTRDCRGIGVVHTRMGIVPAWGGTTRLVQLLGSSRALDVILSARVFPPEEALQVGLIDRIVENAAEADEWLRERTSCSVEVLRAAKLTVTGCQARLNDEAKALSFESRLFSPLWGGRANRAALGSHLKHL